MMNPLIMGGFVGVITCIACVSCFLCLLKLFKYCKSSMGNRNNHATQQEDVYNISGRVLQQQQQQQQQQQGQGQWPPHTTTGQVTLDNFTISTETNKHNDDPPTYEEAMRLAIAASQDPSNNVVSVVVPAVMPPSAAPTAPKPTD